MTIKLDNRAALFVAVLLLAGCGKGGDRKPDGGGAPGGPAPVTFVNVPPVAAGADLDGVWLPDPAPTALTTTEGKRPPLTAAGAKVYATATSDRARSWDKTTRCLPPGLSRLLTTAQPFRIVTGKHLVAMTFQDQRLTRFILLDKGYAPNPDASYLGSATGRWDGATLAVDTGKFKAGTALDASGLPHGPMLTLKERYALDGADRLTDTMTIDDPDYYSAPWTTRLTFKRSAGDLAEQICAEERNLFPK